MTSNGALAFQMVARRHFNSPITSTRVESVLLLPLYSNLSRDGENRRRLHFFLALEASPDAQPPTAAGLQLLTPPCPLATRAHMCAALTRLLCLLLRMAAERGLRHARYVLRRASRERGSVFLHSAVTSAVSREVSGGGRTLARSLAPAAVQFFPPDSPLKPRSFAS